MNFNSSAQKGASLLEVAILTILILFFIWISTQKIWELRVSAEHRAVQSTIAAIQKGISVALYELAVRGEIQQIQYLANRNPTHFLEAPPYNYLGEFEHPDYSLFNGYQWFFDASRKELVYVVQNTDYFKAESGQPVVRLTINLDYTDHNNNGEFDWGSDQLKRLYLIPVEPYQWLLDENQHNVSHK